jgi:hypothetical protein
MLPDAIMDLRQLELFLRCSFTSMFAGKATQSSN